MERDGMVFYRSFYDAIKELPPEDFKKCTVALLEYGLNGTEPETSGIEKTVYIMAKPQIDKNNQRYINGKQGGRNKNQTETKLDPKDKVKDKDKDKVKDKGINIYSSVLCSEQPEAVIKLPLNDKSEYPIYDGAVQEWAGLYPAVDVMQQLRNMKGWLDANPTKRKTRRGIGKFINAWLAREQDRGGNGRTATTPPAKEKKFNYEQRTWDFEELERVKRAELMKNAEVAE